MAFLAICVLSAVHLTGVSMALIQDSPDPPKQDVRELSLEELMEVRVAVKVASLFDESALTVGSTVELITRDNWRRRGARTFADAIGASPGVLVAPHLFAAYTVPVRGFHLATSTRGINTRLDGVPLNEYTSASALFATQSLQLGALNRIEMIRGPGSSLYGADAFNGVLSLQTYESDEDVAELDGELGSDLYRHAAARLSREIGDGWRLDAALSYHGQPDQDVEYEFTDPATGQKRTGERENRFDAVMGVLKLRSDPNATISGRVGLYLADQELEEFQGSGRAFSPAMGPADVSGSEFRLGLAQGGLTFKFEEDLSLEFTGYGWLQESERRADRSNVGLPPTVLQTDEGRAGASVYIRQPDNSWNTQWVVGYEFSYQEVLDAKDSGAPGGEAFFDGDVRRVHSILFQARTSFFDDAFHVLYGARYDNYSDADNHVSPRGGLIYQPTKSSAIKLLYGNAFRPPSAVEARGQAGVVGPAGGEPETIDTLELTFMIQEAAWRAQVTYFRSDWEDAILAVSNPTPPPTLLRENIGENRAHGAEAGLTWISSDFRADVSGSWVESEDRTNDLDYVAFPKFIINAGAGYSLSSLKLDIYLNNRVHLGTDEGPISAFVPDPDELKDYWRTDLTVTWHAPEGRLHAYIAFLNLFDRENFFPSPVGAEGGTPDIGFTVSLGARWTF